MSCKSVRDALCDIRTHFTYKCKQCGKGHQCFVKRDPPEQIIVTYQGRSRDYDEWTFLLREKKTTAISHPLNKFPILSFRSGNAMKAMFIFLQKFGTEVDVLEYSVPVKLLLLALKIMHSAKGAETLTTLTKNARDQEEFLVTAAFTRNEETPQ